MRVIGGTFRSRRLKALPGLATRPTTDKLRETLFGILAGRVAGSLWYDCYAGSGAVGIEALSRGAAHVTFIESSRAAARILRQNLAALGLEDRCTVVEKPVVSVLRRAQRPADFIFLDPPYDAAGEYQSVLDLLGTSSLLRPDGIVVAEHARRQPLAPAYGALTRCRVVQQGDSALSFYSLLGGT